MDHQQPRVDYECGRSLAPGPARIERSSISCVRRTLSVAPLRQSQQRGIEIAALYRQAIATLFRRNGYAATGINEIAELAGAPKGSLYHYFLNGKQQIGEAAVRFAGKSVVVTLEKLELQHEATAAIIQAYCRLAGGLDG